MKKKAKLGRPPKPKGERYRTPARQLGRIPDAEWEKLQAKASEEGLTFTAWAVPNLLLLADGGKIVFDDV